MSTHIIYVEDVNSVNTTTTYSVKSYVEIHPNHGLAGITVDVNCTGFSGSTGIRIYWDYGTPNQQLLNTGTTDARGSYNTTVTIPSAPNGTHSIVAIDNNNYIAQTTFYLGPNIILNPDHGYVGTNVTIQGYTFSPNTNVDIYWDGSYVKSTTTNSTGDFLTYIIVPSSSYGTHEVKAVDSNGNQATAQFFVLASITLSSYSGYVFDNITIHGTGFSANSAAYIYWDSTNTMRSMLTDSNGEFTLTFQIPEDVAGYHSIYAEDLNGVRSNTTYFQIIPSIKLVPSQGYVGENYRVYCYGFAANSILTLLWDGASQPYTVRSDGQGSGIIDAVVPDSVVGNHTVKVYDENLNFGGPETFTVLAVNAPTALEPSGYVNTTSPTLVWTSVDYAVEYELQYDTDPAFTSPVTISHIADTEYTLSGLSDGITYYWRVRAIDSAGNPGAYSNVVSFTVDITPPSSSASVNRIYVNDYSINVYFNASDSTSGVKKVALYYSYEGRDYIYYDEVYAANGVFDFYAQHGDGKYEFYTIVYDNAGNVEPSPTQADCYVIVDTSAPYAYIEALPEYMTTRTFNLSYVAGDNGTGVMYVDIYYSTDLSTWTYYGRFTSSPVTFTAPYDGTFYFQAIAVDYAGNVENFGGAEAHTTVDTNAPAVQISIDGTAGLNGWYVSSVTISFETDADAVVYYSINNGPWLEYGAPFVLGDGIYNITYYAEDSAGNVGNTYYAIVKVDTHVPELSILSPENNAVVSGSVDISANSTDVLSNVSVEYRVDSGAWVTMSGGPVWVATLDTTVLSDGTHTITVRSTDEAGNVVMESTKIVVDNSAPYGYVEDPDAQSYLEGTVIFKVYAYDSVEVGRVVMYIDGAEYDMISVGDYYVLNVDTHTLGDGNHSVYAVIYDESGKSYTTAAVDFYVDNTAPYLYINSPADMEVLSGQVNIDVAVSDVFLDTVEYSVDSSGFVPITTPLNTTMYEDGMHTITVRAIDKAGHITTRSVVVYFDNTPPSIVPVSLPENVVSGEIHIAIKAGEKVGIDSVYCEILKGNETVATYDLSYNGATGYYELYLDTEQLDDGAYTIKVYAVDVSGKERVVTSQFTVDNNAPVIQYSGTSVIHKSTVLEFSVSDSGTDVKKAWISIDGGDWIPVEVSGGKVVYKWNVDLKDNGVHKIRVKAVDSAGNEVTEEYEMYVDVPNLAPIIYIVVLVVLLILVLLIMKRKEKQEILGITEEKPEEREEEMEEPSEEEERFVEEGGEEE